MSAFSAHSTKNEFFVVALERFGVGQKKLLRNLSGCFWDKLCCVITGCGRINGHTFQVPVLVKLCPSEYRKQLALFEPGAFLSYVGFHLNIFRSDIIKIQTFPKSAKLFGGLAPPNKNCVRFPRDVQTNSDSKQTLQDHSAGSRQ